MESSKAISKKMMLFGSRVKKTSGNPEKTVVLAVDSDHEEESRSRRSSRSPFLVDPVRKLAFGTPSPEPDRDFRKFEASCHDFEVSLGDPELSLGQSRFQKDSFIDDDDPDDPGDSRSSSSSSSSDDVIDEDELEDLVETCEKVIHGEMKKPRRRIMMLSDSSDEEGWLYYHSIMAKLLCTRCLL